MQIPTPVGLVFTKSPQGAAVVVANDEIVAAAVMAVPPATFDALGAGEDFVMLNGAELWLGE